MKTFICTLALLLASTLIAAEPKIDQITAAVEKAAAEDKFSGVVLVAKDGAPLLSRAWGMADPAKGIANRVDTKFNLGSINKIFTHVAIGQLAAAGKLSLTDTISKHLPDLNVPSADKITIEQLLQHRSGLGDIFGPKFIDSHASIRKLSDYVPLFAGAPLSFEPGTDQKYSNAGFVILGLIIEKVSGQSYYDYIRDHITKPAGMTDTASFAVDEEVPNRAIGLTKRGPDGPLDKRQSNINTLPARGSSAGGGYSTAADLLRFSQALLADKLLPKRWTDWMFTGKFDAAGHRNIGVAGGSPGVNAVLEIEPPYTVIVMSNLDPPAAMEVGAEARKILGIGGERGPRRGGEGPGEVLIRGKVQIPMELTQHVPVIEAKVNGKGPFHFQVDTGFGGMIQVTPALAKTLALPMIGESIGGDPSGKNQRTMRVYSAESVDIGDAHFGQVETIEGGPHFEGIDGVIGLQLFKSLIVTFDYPNSRFNVDGGALPAADGAKILTYNIEHGVPNIDIDVAGHKVKTDIDSGSPALLSMPLSLAKSLPLASEPQVVGHGRTVGNEFDIYSAPMKGEAHIGGITLTDPRVDFVDLFPVANLGFRFLKDYVVTFDPANHRVRFVK
ncbi:MAG TPA: serine hydrolase [Thermoanaerobaculia bacterium]|jgi:CubicO group peptidase (beta-lactamase class C family)|nr:serine hydrolase [Thermoanaerobaculia bacterium]